MSAKKKIVKADKPKPLASSEEASPNAEVAVEEIAPAVMPAEEQPAEEQPAEEPEVPVQPLVETQKTVTEEDFTPLPKAEQGALYDILDRWFKGSPELGIRFKEFHAATAKGKLIIIQSVDGKPVPVIFNDLVYSDFSVGVVRRRGVKILQIVNQTLNAFRNARRG